MQEAFRLGKEDLDNPQVMLWIDWIRTNRETSLETANMYAHKAVLRVQLCGGFENYWSQFAHQDNLAILYLEKYDDTAKVLAKAEYIKQVTSLGLCFT